MSRGAGLFDVFSSSEKQIRLVFISMNFKVPQEEFPYTRGNHTYNIRW